MCKQLRQKAHRVCHQVRTRLVIRSGYSTLSPQHIPVHDFYLLTTLSFQFVSSLSCRNYRAEVILPSPQFLKIGNQSNQSSAPHSPVATRQDASTGTSGHAGPLVACHQEYKSIHYNSSHNYLQNIPPPHPRNFTRIVEL
jgi:hypothetical protein